MTAFLNALLRREVFAPGMGLALGLSKRRGGGSSGPTGQVTVADLQAQETGTGDVPVLLTTSIDDTYPWILTTTDPAVSPPSLAQVTAGQDHTGSAAAASGTVTTNGLTPVDITLPSGLSGSYYLVVGDVDSVVFDGTAQAIDTTGLAFSSSVPADNATGVAVGSTIAITFNENATGVSGKDFYLYDNIDTTPVLVETFTFSSTTAGTGDNGGTIGISGAAVTLTPGAAMDAAVQHSVRWEAGAITDQYANPVAANTGDTTLNFTTAAIVDDFNRANEALDTSADWTYTGNSTGTPGNIVSNEVNLTGGNFLITSYEHSTVVGATAYASAEFRSNSGGNAGPALFVAGAKQGYSTLILATTIQLGRINNNSFTNLTTSYTHTASAGDKFRIRRDGNDVVADLDTGSGWSEIIRATDTTYTVTRGGLYYYAGAGNNTTLDNFDTGNL